MTEATPQHLLDLNARVRLLEQENARLTNQLEDTVLLGVVHEAISPLQDCKQILDAGLERIALLKDIPICCCGSIENDTLKVVSSSLLFSNASIDGQCIALEQFNQNLSRPHYVNNTECAHIVFPFAPAFRATEILLIPFRSRFLSAGVFLFACDTQHDRQFDQGLGQEMDLALGQSFDQKIDAVTMLKRVVEAMVLAMDHVMVMAELKALNVRLDQRVEQRTEQLHESEAQYRSLIDQAMDSIFVFDAKDGHFIDVNASACSSHGYSNEELLQLSVSDIVINLQPDAFSSLISRLEEEGMIVAENVHQRKNGSTFVVETHLGMILLKGEICVLAISHDVTEREAVKAQLLQAQKMEGIGTLVGGIAHDFNNMLAGMMGNLYLIEQDASLSDDGRSKAGRIHDLCERAASMIAQLLTFARKGVVQMHTIEFVSFMQDSLGLAKLSVPENIDIVYTVECDDSACVLGDAVQLQQLLLNLLVNARDAVRDVKQPCIRIAINRIERSAQLAELHQGLAEGPWLELSVADNGYGIPESIRDQLFDPFFTTKGEGEGTGLGLSTVYGVVQSHQAAIEVESREGEGTCFRVYLPLQGQHMAASAEADQSLIYGHGESILLVDDELVISSTISALLIHLGYRVITARNGVEALSKAKLNDIDLALLDVVMPVMGGVECAMHLRDMNAVLPIVFATAYDQNMVLGRTDALQDCKVLNKPFKLRMLSKVLHEVLKQVEK